MKGTEKLILGCFFVSGLTALVYEVIWVRMMVLIFGATTLATSTVLTSYMGGLALGSLFFGRYRLRSGHPLVLYALLEIGIGCYALLVPWILPLLVPIYQKVWSSFELSFYTFSLLRFALAGMVLLPPTILMGATFPILSRTLEGHSGDAGRRIGMLYALNTFGAVVGVFSTGFILLPVMGMQHTTLITAVMNFLVGATAIIAWRGVQGYTLNAESSMVKAQGNNQRAVGSEQQGVSWEQVSVNREKAEGIGQEGKGSTAHPSLITDHSFIVLITLALSGFAAMVYEVAWSRALSLVLGSTIYAFSAMLTTFLAGLALGSFICAVRVERLRSRVLQFGMTQIGIGVSAFLTLYLMGEIPYLFVGLYQWVSLPRFLNPAILFAIAFLVMLLPTLLMGTLFPLAIKILQFRLPTFGRLAGDVYAVNTLGAILGAFCGGFILIPLFGIQGSVLSMVYLNLILGLVLILVAPVRAEVPSIPPHPSSLPAARLPQPAPACPAGRRQAGGEGKGGGDRYRIHGLLRWGLAGGVILLAGSLAWIKPSWNAQIMSTGVFLQLRQHASLMSQSDRKKFYQELEKDRELLFYKEGITATITVERHRVRGLSMRVNGRSEAGDRFMRTQSLIGHIPVLLARKADDVLVIGFGSGATVGTVAQYPVKRIKVVELEPAVIEASRFFEPGNHRPLDDPRVEVQINDGRNTLLASSEAFDVIISQPSLPWITGASNLFTREFFDLGAMHLKDGGIFGQWISADVVSLENFKSLVKAFHEAFPITWLFEPVAGDFLLIGSRDRSDLNLDKLESSFHRESIRQDLLRIGVEDPYDLLILYQLGGTELDRLVSAAVSNTDDNALVELTGPVHYYGSDSGLAYSRIQEEIYNHSRREATSGKTPLLAARGNLQQDFLLKMARAGLKNNRGPWSLLYTELSLSQQETAEGHQLKGAILASLINQVGLSRKGSESEREKILEEVVEEYQRALQLDPDIEDVIPLRYELGGYYLKRGKLDLATQQYTEILKREANAYEALTNLGSIYLEQGRLHEAFSACQKALSIRPQAPEALFKLGLIYSKMEQYPQAISTYQKVLMVLPDHLEAQYNLARAYELTLQIPKAITHYEQFLTLAPSDASYRPYRIIAQTQLGRIREGIKRE